MFIARSAESLSLDGRINIYNYIYVHMCTQTNTNVTLKNTTYTRTHMERHRKGTRERWNNIEQQEYPKENRHTIGRAPLTCSPPLSWPPAAEPMLRLPFHLRRPNSVSGAAAAVSSPSSEELRPMTPVLVEWQMLMASPRAC